MMFDATHWLVPAALAVFVLQGALMAVDEFGFHLRRAVPLWERRGHPLDTLTVLGPLLITLWIPFAAPWTLLFIALAIFSCVFVTKDEWVHARFSRPTEQWLHALLFLLHPLLFVAIFLLWQAGELRWLVLQTTLAAVFFAWQTLYWNGPWAPKLPVNTPR
jgi:hypothetical protein